MFQIALQDGLRIQKHDNPDANKYRIHNNRYEASRTGTWKGKLLFPLSPSILDFAIALIQRKLDLNEQESLSSDVINEKS